jgi:large subunit ribosomal protein L19e
MSGRNLSAQKRMAMELMKAGQRAVWLDPKCKPMLGAAKTRAQVRELIEKGLIRRKAPRDGVKFKVPPQYWTRYRQRLKCDPKLRHTPPAEIARPAPSSGKRYWKPRFWVKRNNLPALEEFLAKRKAVTEKA